MTTLSELSTRINGNTPLRPLVVAALVKVAGADVRNASATGERRTWASNVLNNPEAAADARVMNVVITNPTVAAKLDNDQTVTDSEIEYIVVQEVLPLIAPI